MPKIIETQAAFKKVLEDNKKVVVDFTASWCGPCRMIGPKFEAMEAEYPGIKFIKVDVDENNDTAAACGISAMPTFHFYLNGNKDDELVGASEDSLRKKIIALEAKS